MGEQELQLLRKNLFFIIDYRLYRLLLGFSRAVPSSIAVLVMGGNNIRMRTHSNLHYVFTVG